MRSTIQDLETQLTAHFDQLDVEIEQYPSDAALWEELPGTKNCGGVLVQHLVGNLQHFIGHVLGHSGYRRERAQEFLVNQQRTRADLKKAVQEARSVVLETLRQLDDADLNRAYPPGHFGDYEDRIAWVLFRLLSHLAYHIGQINYHRRYVGQMETQE